MKELLDSIKQWLEKMHLGNDMYRMCRHGFSEDSLDATTLAYDLEQMIGICISGERADFRKELLDNYQTSFDGFFYEKNAEEALKELHVDRVLEMHGNYLTFQAIGAYKAIDRKPRFRISFYDKYINDIGVYLNNNCPWGRSPWGAGGMVDNLGTIIKCNIEMGYNEYIPVVEGMFDWLDRNQDPQTGLWVSRDNEQGINGLVNGGYHLMRGTYFQFKRKFNFPEKIIDTILEDLTENDIFSTNRAHGCNDLDHFYLLQKCNEVIPDYRKNDVREVVLKRKAEIMDLVYCTDGGFSFHSGSAVSKHNYFDVSPGVKESDMQGTVFYLQTIVSMNKILGIDVFINESRTHG